HQRTHLGRSRAHDTRSARSQVSLFVSFLSHTRRPANQRKPVFAIKLKEPDFAVFNCVHCGEHGYIRAGTPRSHVLKLAEQRRRREEADGREQEDQQRRTASALGLWSARHAFLGSPADTYLRCTRHIGDWLDAFSHLDEVLGYHPRCPFEDGRSPCLLALV